MKSPALLAALAFAAPALVAIPAAHAEPSERSPALATGLSLAPTAVSAGLLAYGLSSSDGSDAIGIGLLGAVFGPSGGHFYAGSYWRAAGGIGLRTAGFALMAVAAVGERGFPDGTPSPTEERGFPVNAGTIGGLVIVAASAVWDVHDAPAAARRYNERHVTVTPTVLSSAHGSVGGVAVVGQF